MVHFFSKNWVEIVVKNNIFLYKNLIFLGENNFGILKQCESFASGWEMGRVGAEHQREENGLQYFSFIYIYIYMQNPEIAYNVPK